MSNCLNAHPFQLDAKGRGTGTFNLRKLKSESIQSIDSSEIDFNEIQLRKDSSAGSSWGLWLSWTAWYQQQQEQLHRRRSAAGYFLYTRRR